MGANDKCEVSRHGRCPLYFVALTCYHLEVFFAISIKLSVRRAFQKMDGSSVFLLPEPSMNVAELGCGVHDLGEG